MNNYRIYVASSWKSEFHVAAVTHLRRLGYSVYDYRQDGFSWRQIDKNWDLWDSHRAVTVLEEPLAEAHFHQDWGALRNADGVLLIMPCGLSAGLEAGYAVGAGKDVITWVPAIREPELMIKMTEKVVEHMFEVEQFFDEAVKRQGKVTRAAGFIPTTANVA